MFVFYSPCMYEFHIVESCGIFEYNLSVKSFGLNSSVGIYAIKGWLMFTA